MRAIMKAMKADQKSRGEHATYELSVPRKEFPTRLGRFARKVWHRRSLGLRLSLTFLGMGTPSLRRSMQCDKIHWSDFNWTGFRTSVLTLLSHQYKTRAHNRVSRLTVPGGYLTGLNWNHTLRLVEIVFRKNLQATEFLTMPSMDIQSSLCVHKIEFLTSLPNLMWIA